MTTSCQQKHLMIRHIVAVRLSRATSMPPREVETPMILNGLRTAPFLVYLLSGLLLLSGASGGWYAHHLFDSYSKVLEVNIASVRAAEELEIGLRDIRLALYAYVYEAHSDQKLVIDHLRRNTDMWLNEASRLATTAKEQEIMQRMNAGYEHFFRELDRNMASANNDRAQIKGLIDSILLKEIILPAHEYLDFNENTAMESVQDQFLLSRSFSLALIGLGVCGCFGGFFAGRQASRRMKRTLVDLSIPLSMAVGKLSEVVGPIRLSTSVDLDEIRDILEKVSVEVEKVVSQFQRSQTEIMRSEKLAAIGQLAAGTAHEIRNPLMSIKILIQHALTNPEEMALSVSDLNLINGEVDRLEKTVQNLLNFSRPPDLTCRRFSFSQLIDQCINLVAGRARIQKVSIQQHPDNEECRVEADFQQMQQVLLNILINALDAMPKGGSIGISVQVDPAKAEVRLSVDDQGDGIPPYILPQIFDPFVSSKDSGTGLGLSICKQIIEAHGGRIFAYNRSVGASVGYSLPLPTLGASL